MMDTYRFKNTFLRSLVLILLISLTMACSALGGGDPDSGGRDSGQAPGGGPADSASMPPESGSERSETQPSEGGAGNGDGSQPGGSSGDNSALLPITPGIDRVSDTGFLHIPGFVENCTGEWINNVHVHIKLYDKDGNEISATSTTGESDQMAYASNDVVPPDGKAYFHYVRDITKIEGTYDHYELSAEAFKSENHGVLEASEIDIEDISERRVNVSGKITNSGSDDCQRPIAIIISSSGGLVYSVDDAYPDEDIDVLKAGQSAHFSRRTSSEIDIDNIQVIGGCTNR